MPIDWKAVFLPVIQEIVVPEIVAFIKKYRDQVGHDPTEEEVKEALALNTEAGISMWDAWFASHSQ